MKLIYGTKNPSKLRGMKKIVDDLNIELLGLNEISIQMDEPVESGSEPLDNARIKAIHYYKALQKPVLAHDAGLYFEGVEECDQPGVFIKRIQGLNMSYEDLVGFYSKLAKKYGGKIIAYYRSAYCLVIDENHMYHIDGSKVASEKFMIVDKPHHKYEEGFPLDSLSVDLKTMKYYYDLEDDEINESNEGFERSLREFFLTCLEKVNQG